jgi:hypothetical protein
MKTRQKILKLSTYDSTTNSKKEEIISDIKTYINKASEDLRLNFYQTTVKEELDKIKENYTPKDQSIEYKIKPGEIEYKSNYPYIFNDEIKYGILADIRDSSNERIDKIEGIFEKIYKTLEHIKDKLKINDRNLNGKKLKQLYEKMIFENNSFNNTIQTMTDSIDNMNNDNLNNKKDIVNIISSLKLNPFVYFEKNNKKEEKINEENKRVINIDSENEIDENNVNSDLSTDRKSKGSFVVNVNM